MISASSEDAYLRTVFQPALAMGGEVPALHRALAVAPAMLRAWRGMAPVLISDCTSPATVRELMILRVAQLLACPYQFDHHVPRARAAGVSDEEIDSLRDWASRPCYSAVARAALAFTEELTTTGHVSSATYVDLASHFDPSAIVELTMVAAFYNCVCRVVGALFEA